MKFKVGNIVTLKHYSVDKINKGIISNTDGDNIVIKPEMEFSVFNYFNNDPVVLGYEEDNIINVCEGVVNKIDYKDNSVHLLVTNVESMKDKRITQRFPVSACAYLENNKNRSFSYIRNICLEGLSLCSKDEYHKNDIINVNTTIEYINFKFEARVIWKKQSNFGFEYGLNYHNVNDDFKDGIGECIDSLKYSQEYAIGKLKHDFESYKRVIVKKISMN